NYAVAFGGSEQRAGGMVLDHTRQLANDSGQRGSRCGVGVMRNAGLVLATLALGSCGYHVGTHADMVPKEIKSIAIPAFGNTSVRYKLTDRMPEAISRELLSRTRYRIAPKEGDADAVLRGTIVNVVIFPIVFDPGANRASAVQINVTMSAT